MTLYKLNDIVGMLQLYPGTQVLEILLFGFSQMEERRFDKKRTANQVWPIVLKFLVKWNMMEHSTSMKMKTMIGLDTSFHIRTRTISICSLPPSGLTRSHRGHGLSRESTSHHKLTLVKLSNLTPRLVEKYCGNISHLVHHTIEMVIH